VTPQQEAAFNQMSSVGPESPEASASAVEGLELSRQYMTQNGPTQPTHRRPHKTMTKAQYEEEKMNRNPESPTNLDADSRVKNLEVQVAGINENITKLANIVTQAIIQRQEEKPTTEKVPSPFLRGGPLPTPLDLPAEGLDESPPIPTVTHPTVALEGPLEEWKAAPESPPGLPTEPMTETGPSENEVPGAAAMPEVSVPLEEVEAIVEESLPPETVEDITNLEKQQTLLNQVTLWLKEKDPHKFFRRFIGGSCNKNLSYNSWPHELQKEFDVRFRQMLADREFASSICNRIQTFQNGHLVAPHVAAAFVVVCAGVLAFTLAEA